MRAPILRPHTDRARGFSMLEVMIVTGLMAVLVSLAVPAYQSLSMRSYRTEAVAALMRAAACQERLRVVSGMYSAGDCQIPSSGRYQFVTSPDDELASLGFTITASPVGSQASDPCGAISLDHNGFRRIENAQADVTRCWSGR